MATKILFQIIGSLVLLHTLVILLAVLFVPRAAALLTSSLDYIRLIALITAGAALGIGVWCLRKWAAIGVSLLLLYPAYWCVYGAVHPIPGYFNWVGFFFALLLIGPLVLTIVGWRTLTWRGTLASAKSRAANRPLPPDAC